MLMLLIVYPSIRFSYMDLLILTLFELVKSGGHKHRVNFELTISSQKQVFNCTPLLPPSLSLSSRSNTLQVEDLGDDVIGEDCIQIMMIVNAEERKVGTSF